MMQETTNENAAVYVGHVKDLICQNRKTRKQRCKADTTFESLTGQRHDRVQTENQIAAVDSCFDLDGSRQHGVTSDELIVAERLIIHTYCHLVAKNLQ